jgi:hypothetical protein
VAGAELFMTRVLMLVFFLVSIPAYAAPPPTAKAATHDEGAHSAWADHDPDKRRNKLVKKKKKSNTFLLAPSQPK